MDRIVVALVLAAILTGAVGGSYFLYWLLNHAIRITSRLRRPR